MSLRGVTATNGSDILLLSDDMDQVLLRAKNAGVDRMIVTAGNMDDCHSAWTLVKGNDALYMTVGCHPTRSTEFESHPDGPEAYFNELKAMLDNPEAKSKIVAIGECGLDYDRLHFCPKETQKKYFERQFDLAESTGLPMFLHDRNTGKDFGELITKHRSRFSNGVVHSFTGTLEEMQSYLDLGLYIGINGCSLKTEENLKVAASVPLDRLMLETDGPWCDIRPTHASHKHLSKMSAEQQALYVPPSKKKERFEMGSMVKSRNEPCTMGQVLHVMASLHNMDPAALAQVVYDNTSKTEGKIAQRMKVDSPSAPPVESHKLVKKATIAGASTTLSKKRKSVPGFGAVPSYGAEITRMEDVEEQDENNHHAHIKKKSPKTIGGVPSAKKLRGLSTAPDRSSSLYSWMNKAPLAERSMHPHPKTSKQDHGISSRLEAIEKKAEEMTLNTSSAAPTMASKRQSQAVKETCEEQLPSSAAEADDFDSLWMTAPETKITNETSQDTPKPKPKPKSSNPNGKVKKSTELPKNDDPEPKTRKSMQLKTGPLPTSFDDDDELSDPPKATPAKTIHNYFRPSGKGTTTVSRPERKETTEVQDVVLDISTPEECVPSPKKGSKGTKKVNNNRLESESEEVANIRFPEEYTPSSTTGSKGTRKVSNMQSPESEPEDEEEAKPRKLTRLVRRADSRKSAIVSSSESEDAIVIPETEPGPEKARSPSPSTKRSQSMMASFLGKKSSPKPSSPMPTTEPFLPETNPNGTLANRTSFPIVQAKYGSKKQPPKQKPKKKSSFSDSDEPGVCSEIEDSSSDWDDSFMKRDEKPDPNQKAITSMFSASSRPVIPLRPRTKRELSAQSQALLSGGLSNYSNTCYLNSVLQTLRNTVECRDTFFGIQDKMNFIEKKLESPIKLTEYQRSLFEGALAVMKGLDQREEFGSEEEVSKTVYPKDVISTLHGGKSLFNSHSQQDAAEFMFYVISQFDDVLREITLAGRQDTLAPEDMIPKDWQPINELFQVSTQSVTHCLKCPAVTTNEDRGIDLTVQIDNENPTLVRDLNWGIMETMKMEHMKDDNQRFCEKCNTKEDAHVYHYFTSLPKIMILRLQRYNFKEGAIKLQNSVSCTEQLNFKEWMCGEYLGPDPRYELCAVIIHRGRVITSGHYYVYIRKPTTIETILTDPDGESRTEQKTYSWLKYNDSVVDPTSDEEIAKLFSGNVGTYPDTSPVSGSESSNPGTPKKDLWNLLETDAATPYVYIYRRIEAIS
ncbi:TatD DNase [Podila clonocystis]|nr:TatD DNase [Podila clonocystis]